MNSHWLSVPPWLDDLLKMWAKVETSSDYPEEEMAALVAEMYVLADADPAGYRSIVHWYRPWVGGEVKFSVDQVALVETLRGLALAIDRRLGE